MHNYVSSCSPTLDLVSKFKTTDHIVTIIKRKTSPNTWNILDLWIFNIKYIYNIYLMALTFSWTAMFLFLLHAERKSIIQACAGNWRMTRSMTTTKCFNVLTCIFISVPHDMELYFLPTLDAHRMKQKLRRK